MLIGRAEAPEYYLFTGPKVRQSEVFQTLPIRSENPLICSKRIFGTAPCFMVLHAIVNVMKSFLFLVFMLVSVQMYAQKFTSVKGFVKNDRLTQVELYKTVDGQPELYATSGVAPDGSYGFLFAPQEAGFYAVGDKRMNFMVYVKGGEEVNLDLYADKAQLNGKNTKENKALYQWEDYAADVRLKSVFFDRTISNYEDFFPEFEKFIAGRETLRKGLKSGNKEFDRMLQKLIDYETDYFAVIFLQTPRTKHPQRTDWPDY